MSFHINWITAESFPVDFPCMDFAAAMIAFKRKPVYRLEITPVRS